MFPLTAFCYIRNCFAWEAKALSVTCGDSSPRGRAKEGLPLPLGEVSEQSEDGEGKDGASVL